MSRVIRVAVAVVVLAAGLAWLRDPAWLAGVESGIGGWERDAAGVEYRWTAGRASFFVDATLGAVVVPLRIPMQPGDWPATVTLEIDGRPADRFTITTGDWHRRSVSLPAPGSRHLRRLDIHVNRTRPGNRGVQLGRVELVPGPTPVSGSPAIR